MKRILFAVPVILSLLISACAAEQAAVPAHSPQLSPPPAVAESAEDAAVSLDEHGTSESADVSFHIRTNQINVLTSWLDFDIANHSANEYSYGEEITLYRLADAKWEYVELLPESDWNQIGIILTPFSTNSGSIDLSRLYGELHEGMYRIEKDIFSVDGDAYSVAAEFEVGEIEK
jgi:hypothetical protein